MPTVRIDRDERYPVYDFNEASGGVVDVDDATLVRWRRVLADYDQVQAEMDAALRSNPAYFDGTYWHI